MTIFSSDLEVLYHALLWTRCCWMCVVPRIASLLRGGSGWSRLPAAYLLYSSTHTNAKQNKWSELRKETRRATKKTFQHVILMIKVSFMCVSCGFLQVCWWSSAAMCDQTFVAATFGPCDSCSKPSPLMNIYIKNEATNYCSLCVEMVMFSFHFHRYTSPQKSNKRQHYANEYHCEWLQWVCTAVYLKYNRACTTYDCCGSLELFITII